MKRTSFISLIISLLMLSGCSSNQTNDGHVYFDCLEPISNTTPTLSRSELKLPTADLIDLFLGEAYDSVFRSGLFSNYIYVVNKNTGEVQLHLDEQDVVDDYGRTFHITTRDHYEN